MSAGFRLEWRDFEVCYDCGVRPRGAFRRFVVVRAGRRFHQVVDRHRHESRRMRTGFVGPLRGSTLDAATRILQTEYLRSLREAMTMSTPWQSAPGVARPVTENLIRQAMDRILGR